MQDSGTPPHGLPGTLAGQYALWASGIDYEIGFWTSWAATRGAAWPEDFARRMDPATPLAPWIADRAVRMKLPHLRILDVGAGPVTSLGYVPPEGLTVELVAADPLAAAYDRIFDAAGLVRPVRTVFATAEDLSAYLPAASFDIVHCCNALDHSFDPMRGLVEMLRLARLGGYVTLYHHANEAEAEGYSGFHQHNFDVRNGRFVIWRGTDEIDVARQLPVEVEMQCSRRDNVSVILHKKSEFPAEPDHRFRDRLARSSAAWIELMIRQRMP